MTFRELISEQLLFYAWNSLKFDCTYIKTFEPISKSWFKKCALLMRKGSFDYDNLHEIDILFSKTKKVSLKLLKYKIIEGAILNIIQLKLEKYAGFEKSNSIREVCNLFNKSLCVIS